MMNCLLTYVFQILLAEKEGFVVIWPQGNMDAGVTYNTCWNAGACCCFDKDFLDPLIQYVNIDDSGFLRQAISNTADNVIKDANVTIDTTRIYFAGHSNGCMMGQNMASQASDLVAAVCCHSGILVSDIASSYKPTPIHVVHGELDLIVPFNHSWQGFDIAPDNAVDSFRFWGDTNGCKKMDTTVDDSNLYSTHSFSDCNDNANVQLLQVFNGGHTPYLGVNYTSPGESPDVEITNVDTTMLSWDFCSQYQSESKPTLPNPVPYVSSYTFIDASNNNTSVIQPSSDGSYISTNLIPGLIALIYFVFRF